MYPCAQAEKNSEERDERSSSGTGTDDSGARTNSRKRGIFVADDKFPDVIHALLRRGWTRSGNANSPNFHLKWRNLSNINFRLLRRDQFVNHLFNSQQLSNKALLTGHLAFEHDHERSQQQQHQHQHQQKQRHQFLEGPGASEHGSGVDSVSSSPYACSAPGSYGPSQGQACNNASDLVPPAATATAWKAPIQAASPETFFPRCWDVSDDGDGVCSMLRAFAVSAAVALLRTAVNAEDEGWGERQDGVGGGGSGTGDQGARAVGSATLAAATSVISRYASLLQTPLNTPPTSAGGGHLLAGPPLSGRERRVGQKSSGRNAVDAAVTVGDPEFITILTAWETAAAAQGAAEKVGSGHAGGCADEQGADTGKAGVVVPEPCEVAEEEPGHEPWEEVDVAHGTTGENKARSGKGREEEELARGNSSSVATARELLRALDEDGADPQATLCLGPANAWVVKPAGLSCGRGVEVTSSLRGLVSACRRLEWKAVVQKYVERPLLVQGYKFDIRQWVLVTSCNPLTVWGFDESYARFSSRPFTMDAPSLSDRLVHLCNHSVQKQQDRRGDESCAASGSPDATGVNDDSRKGAGSGDGRETLPSGSQQNMWTAGQLRNHLRQRFQGHDVFQEVVVPRIRSVVVQTLLSVREELEMKGRAVEWLGFDLMVAEDLRVMLIEVNVSPDVSHSTPVTARLVPDATEDALSLLLDDGEADKRAAATPLPGLPNPCHSSSPSTGAEVAGEAKAVPGPDLSRVHDSGVGDRREGEASPRVVDKLRWRLWHKGEEESRTVLRSLREAKKAHFEERRNKKRSRHFGDSSSSVPGVEDDRGMALAAVEGILDSSRARIAAGQAVAPAAEALAPGPPSMVSVSPSESRRTAPAEGSMEGRRSSNCSEGRTQDAWETVGELRGMVREKLGL